MKKYLLVAIICTLLLIGCGKSKVLYEDGVYQGVSSVDENGYMRASVTIKDGKIKDVELFGYGGDGLQKTADYPWAAYHESLTVLPQRFVEANSAKVDIITAATGTSEDAMEAVKEALEAAEKK